MKDTKIGEILKVSILQKDINGSIAYWRKLLKETPGAMQSPLSDPTQ